MSEVFTADYGATQAVEEDRHPGGWAKDGPGNLGHALETLGFAPVGFAPMVLSTDDKIGSSVVGFFTDVGGNTVIQLVWGEDQEHTELFYSGASADPESQLAYLLERFGHNPNLEPHHNLLTNNPSGEPGC